MLIIGCDYHPSFQQIAFVNTDTGELSERRLAHREQAAQFLPGTEATPSRHAEWAKDRQSSDGAQTGSASVAGCGVRAAITANCRSSVRTRESPEIPMVCSKTPM